MAATAVSTARPDYSAGSRGEGTATTEAAAGASVPPDVTIPDANSQPFTLEDLYIFALSTTSETQRAQNGYGGATL